MSVEGNKPSTPPLQFVQSEIDDMHYTAIRTTVRDFTAILAAEFDAAGITVLDVAPESHAGAAASFQRARVDTIDIDPNSGATYVADLCACNCTQVPSNSFDVIVCTEVLEHTRQPWNVTKEMHRLLKPGGVLAVTTPFNFRLHGPSPDCWRFTDEGLKVLLADFVDVQIKAVEDPKRPRMPIQYTAIGRKREGEHSSCWDPQIVVQ